LVNQRDVAKKAGVSSATVSAVINNNKFVSKRLKEKVLKAIEELNYEVDLIARSLKINRTYTIGVIVGNILSNFYSIIAKSIEDTVKKYNYSMILCNGDDDPSEELKYLKILKSNKVDGIILTPTNKNVQYINKIIESGTKVVLIDRLIEGVNCDAVIVDNRNGSYKAIKYLIGVGYKKIAAIISPIEFTTGKGRLEGYLDAIDEASLPLNSKFIKIGCSKKDDGINMTKELLRGSERPEVIFTGSLDLTLGAIIALKELKLNIPDDIGLLGWDDVDWSAIIDPPLTVVGQPIYDLGVKAAEILMKKIKGDKEVVNSKSLIKTLSTHLIVRNSTK
jgi:LacI family transcriptional regulator